MDILIIKEKINRENFKKIVKEWFEDMTKAVVDIEKEVIALGGELHSDALKLMIEKGYNPKNLWGINIYVDKDKDQRIEYNSLINIRPLENNRSLEIQSQKIKEKIRKIVDKLIE